VGVQIVHLIIQGNTPGADRRGCPDFFDELPVCLIKTYHRAFFVVRALIDL
jgi:hypothetical protein